MDAARGPVGTDIRSLSRQTLSRGMVQVSLDLKTIDDALRMAAVAVAAGADWLEIGTPLALSQGTAAVRELRAAFPGHPLVADLKIMDGGYGEAALYAAAGADAVVVMGRAHDATIERVCDAARDLGLLVMGDDLGAEDPVAPPVWGEQVAAQLPVARQIVVPATGHVVTARGCVPLLIGQFLKTAQLGALDARCLDGLQRPPFVTTSAGDAR